MGFSLDQARAAKDKAKQLFTTNVGVGITRVDDGYAVKVNLRNPLPEGENTPTSIDGVPVQIEVVGEIRKQ
jgi:hypothetical protein